MRGGALTYDGASYRAGDDIRLAGGGGPDVGAADHVPAGCEFDLAWYVAPS